MAGDALIVTRDEGSVPVKNWATDIDDGALLQAKNIARLPFIHRHGVVLMPDAHWGKGSTVGSVIATEKAIIPAAVGVDIGCGMCAVQTTLKASDLPDSLADLRSRIEAVVPVGAGGNHRFDQKMPADMMTGGMAIFAKYPEIHTKSWLRQIGTLGGGNHFIEMCLDEEQRVWIMLHSGSRGIGNSIGKFFIDRAKKLMEIYHINLPDADLAYLPDGTETFKEYWVALQWAQFYALYNRGMMMQKVFTVLVEDYPTMSITEEAINCHHNYTALENHFGQNLYITRKGAIRARAGDLGIVPGSMGAKSYIVRGKGNTDSYCSCSHGAGRVMGRKEAQRRFTVADLEAQTAGIECRKDEAVLDEIPAAYKDIDVVMANQADLVEVVHTLKQVMCIKGN